MPAFKAAYEYLITKSNIRVGFRGIGLVPFNPKAVLLKLNVKLWTPILPIEVAL